MDVWVPRYAPAVSLSPASANPSVADPATANPAARLAESPVAPGAPAEGADLPSRLAAPRADLFEPARQRPPEVRPSIRPPTAADPAPLAGGRGPVGRAQSRGPELQEMRLARHAHPRRLWRRQPPRRLADHRRGARAPKRTARASPSSAAPASSSTPCSGHRPAARDGFHRERAEVPAARQPRPQAG